MDLGIGSSAIHTSADILAFVLGDGIFHSTWLWSNIWSPWCAGWRYRLGGAGRTAEKGISYVMGAAKHPAYQPEQGRPAAAGPAAGAPRQGLDGVPAGCGSPILRFSSDLCRRGLYPKHSALVFSSFRGVLRVSTGDLLFFFGCLLKLAILKMVSEMEIYKRAYFRGRKDSCQNNWSVWSSLGLIIIILIINT